MNPTLGHAWESGEMLSSSINHINENLVSSLNIDQIFLGEKKEKNSVYIY